MEKKKSPIIEVIEKIKDPNNILSEEDKDRVKKLTGDVGSAVKTSLIDLMLGQFSKVAIYDGAIQQIMKKLITKMDIMDPEELIQFLGVLAKTSTTESKNVMDMFRKQGDDFKALIEQIEHNNQKSIVVETKDESNVDGTTKTIINMSPDKKSKLLRLINKVSEDKDKVIDAEKKD